jgi:hypothetical protein
MKYFILTLITLVSISASAGKSKISWTHTNQAIDGAIITLTGFNFYWRVDGGPEQKIQYWPPMPTPWKVEGGVFYWTKTFEHAAWIPGSTVCFQATALSGPAESGRSNQVCKKMPADPAVPVIIDITTP